MSKEYEKTIRVLNLFTIMDRGGAETMVMNYYRNIDRTKVQFDFMVHRSERGAYDDEIESMGGRIYRMPPIRPWTAHKYRKTVAKFYGEHPEYKIIHSHMSELGCYDFIESERKHVPVRICHAHNAPHGIDMKSIIRWYYKKRMMSHITHMFMCGEESGEWLFGKKNRASFVMLNNAIDTEKYRYDRNVRQKIREELHISEEQVVIGHIGRFATQKNHTFLLEVFNEIQKKIPDAVLLLVGDDTGEYGKEIHRKAEGMNLKKNVRFLGVRSDVNELLQAMDVFLFPSLFEGLSVASIEAQAAGLPVVISDGVPIECKKTDLVKVVPLSETAETWSEAVIKCIGMKQENAVEQIKNAGFDIKKNAKWLEQFYVECDRNIK